MGRTGPRHQQLQQQRSRIRPLLHTPRDEHLARAGRLPAKRGQGAGRQVNRGDPAVLGLRWPEIDRCPLDEQMNVRVRRRSESVPGIEAVGIGGRECPATIPCSSGWATTHRQGTCRARDCGGLSRRCRRRGRRRSRDRSPPGQTRPADRSVHTARTAVSWRSSAELPHAGCLSTSTRSRENGGCDRRQGEPDPWTPHIRPALPIRWDCDSGHPTPGRPARSLPRRPLALRADETAREPGEFSSRAANASTAAPNASAADTLLTTRIAVIVTKRARGDNSPLRERAVPSLKMSTSAYAARPAASTPALFGRVMGLVAVTVGFATLGVWLGRDSGGATWFISWLLALGCLFGLQFANARGNTGLALVLLFAFGLLIGVSVSMTVNYYSAVDPTAVRQAFAATALFVGVLGSGGYAVRRDLSFLYRFAFFGLLALLLAGIVLIFVHIRRPTRSGRSLAWPSSGSTRSRISTACVMRVPTRRSRSPRASFSMS